MQKEECHVFEYDGSAQVYESNHEQPSTPNNKNNNNNVVVVYECVNGTNNFITHTNDNNNNNEVIEKNNNNNNDKSINDDYSAYFSPSSGQRTSALLLELEAMLSGGDGQQQKQQQQHHQNEPPKTSCCSSTTRHVLSLEPRIAALERALGFETNHPVATPLPALISRYDALLVPLNEEVQGDKCMRSVERGATALSNAMRRYSEHLRALGVQLQDHDVTPVLPNDDTMLTLDIVMQIAPHVNGMVKQMEGMSALRSDLILLAQQAESGQDDVFDDGTDVEIDKLEVMVNAVEQKMKERMESIVSELNGLQSEILKKK
eukprot:PhM_4_TR8943/c0_g1_i1/m.64674